MAFWNRNQIISVNDGSVPNDGTGDDIRDAFIKVNNSFSNVSTFLTQTSLDFLGANIETQLNVGTLNATNSFTANTTGTWAAFSANVSGNSLVANSNVYSGSIIAGNVYTGNLSVVGATSLVGGNISVGGSLIPTANVQYDLGNSTNFFRNIYAQGLIEVNTVSLQSSASILELQPNVSVGVPKDVGVIGQYNQSGANNFAYFGFQAATDNFIYYQTPYNSSTGNSINYGGVYGNTQFGSQLLSNTTISTSTSTGALIVAGGAGIAGNLNAATIYGNLVSNVATVGNLSVTNTLLGNLSVAGNIYSAGYQVITTNTPGISLYSGNPVFNTNVIITSATTSTSTSTGALILSYGGIGVAGNVYAGGLYGPYYGTIQTAAQPNITSLGAITTLNAGSISATSIGVQNITAYGLLNFTSANAYGFASLSVVGNTSSGNLLVSGNIYTSTLYAGQVSNGFATLTLDTAGNVLLTNTSGAFGYGKGSGSSYIQNSSTKTYSVSITSPTGQIAMANTAIPASTTISFQLLNGNTPSILYPSDIVMTQIVSGTTNPGNYNVWVGTPTGATTPNVYVRNISAGSLTEPLVLSYAVIRTSGN